MDNKKSIDLSGLAVFKEENDYATEQQLAGKVDKVTGKGLSTNDYTNEDKTKVAAALTQHQDISGKANASDVYTKSETYNKTEVHNLITTPNQQYVSVTATDQTTAVTDLLPATGAADTTYRVGNWDGTQYNDSVFSEYAWNGSAYIKLSTKSQVGEVYDISANHANTKYSDLAAALGADGVNIPQSLRKGGMSVKFMQSPGNKYVQYRLMSNTFSTTVTDWQGVDKEPTDGSHNLVESSGVAEALNDQGVYFVRHLTFNEVGSKIVAINKTMILKAGSYIRIIGNITSLSQDGMVAAYFKTSDNEYIQKNIDATGSFSFEYQATSDIQLVEYGVNTNYALVSGECLFLANLAPDFYKFREQQIPLNVATNELINGIFGYFLNATVGYIGAGGVTTHVSASDLIVTDYIPVTEGQQYKYRGGWHQNDDISMVWGYDSNKQNPVALVRSANGVIDTEFIVPTGVNYIRAWSQNTFVTPSLLNAESLPSRVDDLEKTVSELTLAVDTSDVAKSGTTSNFRGFVINKTYMAASNSVIKKLYFYSPTSSNVVKVGVCTKNGENRFKIKSVYYVTIPDIGKNEIEVNIPFNIGEYLGVFIDNITDMLPYSTTQTDGWYWQIGTGMQDLVVGQNIQANYLENFSLAYGYYSISRDDEGFITETVIATRNESNYNSIREIVNSLDASEKHRYIVYIPNGEWFESDLQGKNYVELVGQDRDSTIIYCDGTSDKLTPDDYSYDGKGSTALNQLEQSYKHVFFVKNNCIVRNVTIRAKSCKYCVHLDNDRYSNAIFDNCMFYDLLACNHPVGIGAHSGQNIKITNCVFRCTDPKTGLVIHNWNNQANPTKILIKDSLFDNCGFINVDELGSDQNDDWQLTNCYSNIGGFLTFMVDTYDNKTYYTNPSTGEKETDPTLVPYSIKLNCLGSNVVSCRSAYYNGSAQRPEFAKYLITDHYIKVLVGSYTVGSVVKKIQTGALVDAITPIGVVEHIIDGYAYIARDTVWLSQDSIQGTATLNAIVYENEAGKVSVNTSSLPIGKIVAYHAETGLYQVALDKLMPYMREVT